MIAKPNSGYLPSLDGWRALAILGVLFVHDLPWSFGGVSNHVLLTYGGSGVNLFFAISGLLITTRILEEEKLSGRFQIKGFYTRRIFRIQPAAMAYLAVIGLLIATQVISMGWFHWVAALLMYENFVWRPWAVLQLFFVGHFWTLAVEEHFYILLSLLLFFLRRYRLAALSAAYVVLYLVRRMAESHHLYDPLVTGRRTYWQLDFLIFPAMVAIALQRPRVRAWALHYWRPWVAIAVTVGLMVLHRLSMWARHRGPMPLTFHGWGQEIGMLNQYMFALLVAATMLHGSSWTTRVLEWAPLRFVGRISYSLYLWHVLFFFRMEPNHVSSRVLMLLSGEHVKFFAAFAVAIASYYLLEKPMMRLGHRLAPPVRPGRNDLEPEPAVEHGAQMAGMPAMVKG